MSVKAVVRMKPEDIRLVWFFKVLKEESTLVHVEITFLLLKPRIDTFEVDQSVALCYVITLNCDTKLPFVGLALN